MTRPDSPDVYDVMHAWLDEHRRDTHTALPGRVERYDAATQVADVLPLVRAEVPQPDGSIQYEDLPVVPSVPVVLPRVGSWFLSLPIAAGDTVLLVFCEAAIGHWWAGDGSVQYPGDLRRHHLAHAVAIPGLFVRGKALAHASGTDLVIGSDEAGGARITIRPDGTVSIVGGAGEDFVALAAKVDAALAEIRTLFNTHTHSGGTLSGATGVPAALLPAASSVAATRVKAT